MKQLIFKQKKIFLVLLLSGLYINTIQAQQEVELKGILSEDEDTLLLANQLPTVHILSKRNFNSLQEKADFYKLQAYVKIVYPYAKLAAAWYQKIHADLEFIDKKRKQNKYLKRTEKELRNEFEDKLKKLTVKQGKLLVMLINRETENNCYTLIQELKSPIAAYSWNFWAKKKYGYDLKSPYIPENNLDIEWIIKQIEEEEIFAKLKE